MQADVDALRRRTMLSAATPLLASLLAACATEPQVQTTTLRDPAISKDAARLLFRHVNTVVVCPDVNRVSRAIDIFWSQSCGDSMRAYGSTIAPFLRGLTPGTAVALHLVARGQNDLGPCVTIRSVDPASYGQAVRAILEAGAERAGPLPENEVNRLVSRFPSNGNGFVSGFAENCSRLAQRQSVELGVDVTPAFFVNGRKTGLAELHN